LFTVETILGHMTRPTASTPKNRPARSPRCPPPRRLKPNRVSRSAATVTAGVVEAEAGFAEVADAIGEIEDPRPTRSRR
jgi:hypothetical protein